MKRPFDLITDHGAQKWQQPLDAEDCQGRRALWIDFQQQFEINPIHRREKILVMSMANYLSRVNARGDL